MLGLDLLRPKWAGIWLSHVSPCPDIFEDSTLMVLWGYCFDSAVNYAKELENILKMIQKKVEMLGLTSVMMFDTRYSGNDEIQG